MSETCADCGKPIQQNDPSYYQMDPACCIGKSYHSACGPMRPTPQGILQAENARLRAALEPFANRNNWYREGQIIWTGEANEPWTVAAAAIGHEQGSEKTDG